MTFISLINCRLEENERMDRREQAKQQQKHQMQMQMQRLSQNDNDSPQTPLFGVPKKVSQTTFSKNSMEKWTNYFVIL